MPRSWRAPSTAESSLARRRPDSAGSILQLEQDAGGVAEHRKLSAVFGPIGGLLGADQIGQTRGARDLFADRNQDTPGLHRNELQPTWKLVVEEIDRYVPS